MTNYSRLVGKKLLALLMINLSCLVLPAQCPPTGGLFHRDEIFFSIISFGLNFRFYLTGACPG